MKLAILGASSIAAKILPVLKERSVFELAGIASQNSDRGIEFAKTHGTNFLGDYQSIFRNRSVSAIYIATSNQEHEACIESALLAGQHVLCEKPLVLNPSAAIRLFELSKMKGLILLEGLMYRFHPQIQELAKRVRSGDYGTIKRSNANFCFDYGTGLHFKRRLSSGGGALPDLGCYLIDFVNLLSNGSPLQSIQKLQPLSSVEFEAQLRLKNGLVADLRASSFDVRAIHQHLGSHL